ncbi:MAG: 50S ribosomal protein L24 [Spirochaetales bacterium]|nr:50S ribosomal protein L24 [Spirochaetales bacterium]MCF7937796.1 50S ribosomal protein L24 [Spirochaetales bacterium]
MKLKVNDQVRIISGREKGKEGRILRLTPDHKRVIVEGLNMVKKARKQRKQGDQSGIIEIEAPVHASNVKVICPSCGPTRLAYSEEAGEKIRVCKKCGEAL